MPPKKDGKKKKGKGPEFTVEDIEAFVKMYKKFSQECDIPVYEPLCRRLLDDGEGDQSEFMSNQQLVIAPVDPMNPSEPRLGPGGCRALCTAILATGPGMEGTAAAPYKPFKAVKAIRMWHSAIGDDGACALAELLRLGGAEVTVEYMEVWDSGIGARGCRALGVALMMGYNTSLQSLRLDYNSMVGSEGCSNICRGLRSNQTLKQLHLPFCDIGPEAGVALSEALSFANLGLMLLNLEGNRLGDSGLSHLLPGLHKNVSLIELNLADNQIGANPSDVGAMEQFAQVISEHKTLHTLNLNFNRLCPEACDALLKGVSDPADPLKPHPRLKAVIIDAALVGVPPEVYDRLIGPFGASGKKGGKKGKKKK